MFGLDVLEVLDKQNPRKSKRKEILSVNPNNLAADNNRSFDQGWDLDRQLKLSLKEGQAISPICFGGELPAHSQLEQKKESRVME